MRGGFVITFILLAMMAVVGLIFGMVYILGGDNKSSSAAAEETKTAKRLGNM